MSTLNMYAASLMRKYDAHGATDITGFGILGHAKNLAAAQSQKVDFAINHLPIISGMTEIENITNYGLLQGNSAETSGGLLIIIPKSKAKKFVKKFKSKFGLQSWIIGEVVKGKNSAYIQKDFKVSEC